MLLNYTMGCQCVKQKSIDYSQEVYYQFILQHHGAYPLACSTKNMGIFILQVTKLDKPGYEASVILPLSSFLILEVHV